MIAYDFLEPEHFLRQIKLVCKESQIRQNPESLKMPTITCCTDKPFCFSED